MFASLLLTSLFAAPPTAGLATLPRREGAAPASTLIRVDSALTQQLEHAGLRPKQLTPAQRRQLQACSLSAPCVAQLGKAAGVDVVVRANVTVFADNVALVLTAVSTRRSAIVAEEGFGVSPAHIEDELGQRSARFISSVAVAAGATETPPISATPAPPPPAPVSAALGTGAANATGAAAANATSAPPTLSAAPAVPPPPELTPQSEPLPPPPAAPPVHIPGEHPAWSRPLAWSFTAGAGALAIGSALFLGLGADAHSTWNSSLTTSGGLTATRLSADQAHSLASRGNFDLTLGVSLGVAAVAFAAAALIFFLTG